MNHAILKTEDGSITWLTRNPVCSFLALLIMIISFDSHAVPIDCEENCDYGDAPDPTYPTLLANNGARHSISNLYLGASVDADADGQPNATATGDDNDGNDDEDGVVFTSVIIAGQTVTLDVTASASGYLNAWIDFSIDGDWADVGEQIFADLSLSSGLNSLSFTAPVTATLGTTFARFRFDSGGGLSYDGLADDGEVEDYQIEVQAAQIIPEPSTLALLSLGLVGLGFTRRRMKT